nr:MAG TPA: hypothetical protein [Caudoviricetes sp.]
MIAKHIDRFPLLKLDQVIDWQPIEQYPRQPRADIVKQFLIRPTARRWFRRY